MRLEENELKRKWKSYRNQKERRLVRIPILSGSRHTRSLPLHHIAKLLGHGLVYHIATMGAWGVMVRVRSENELPPCEL